jgi:N-formylglutamate amidohydrolase
MNMDAIVAPGAAKTAPVYVIHAPAEQTVPFVYCSPHSGTDYAEAFRRASKLDYTTLRKSEDSHVDALFGAAPAAGAPLLCALFPRAYVDPNHRQGRLQRRRDLP